MHRAKNLFSQILDFNNLYRAFLGASHGKRDRQEVREFEYHLETRLCEMRRELEARAYDWGVFRRFWIDDVDRHSNHAGAYVVDRHSNHVGAYVRPEDGAWQGQNVALPGRSVPGVRASLVGSVMKAIRRILPLQLGHTSGKTS